MKIISVLLLLISGMSFAEIEGGAKYVGVDKNGKDCSVSILGTTEEWTRIGPLKRVRFVTSLFGEDTVLKVNSERNIDEVDRGMVKEMSFSETKLIELDVFDVTYPGVEIEFDKLALELDEDTKEAKALWYGVFTSRLESIVEVAKKHNKTCGNLRRVE